MKERELDIGYCMELIITESHSSISLNSSELKQKYVYTIIKQQIGADAETHSQILGEAWGSPGSGGERIVGAI